MRPLIEKMHGTYITAGACMTCSLVFFLVTLLLINDGGEPVACRLGNYTIEETHCPLPGGRLMQTVTCWRAVLGMVPEVADTGYITSRERTFPTEEAARSYVEWFSGGAHYCEVRSMGAAVRSIGAFLAYAGSMFFCAVATLNVVDKRRKKKRQIEVPGAWGRLSMRDPSRLCLDTTSDEGEGDSPA